MSDRVFGPDVCLPFPWALNDVEATGRAGVYRLEHHPSGYVYAGSSTRLWSRMCHWRMRLRRLHHPAVAGKPPSFFRMSPKFHAVARGLSLSGWSFVVVERIDLFRASLVDLHSAELREIHRLDALAPDLLLNVIKTTRPPSYRHDGFSGAGSRHWRRGASLAARTSGAASSLSQLRDAFK